MRYKDLPEPRPDTPLKGGGTLLARQPVLYCRGCGEAYSANPGDYWDRKESEAVCGECDTPLVLAEPRPQTYIPYGGGEDFRRYLDAAWDAIEEPDTDDNHPCRICGEPCTCENFARCEKCDHCRL